MRWFRMHADAIANPKLKLIAFEDRWHFVAVCCMKSEGLLDEDRDDALRERLIAAQLGLTLQDAAEVKRRLSEVELIHSDWQPKGWSKYQYESDSSADRVRRHREKKQQGNGVKRYGNVTVTAPDTDTDSETKEKRGTRKRATPPPKSFEITDGHREWAKANAQRVDLAAETAKFLDYHTAKGNTLKDWEAAWRNWMRKAVEFKTERAGPEPPPDALPRGHPPHLHPEKYAALDDDGKRMAWQAWQTNWEKRRQGDAVSTQ